MADLAAFAALIPLANLIRFSGHVPWEIALGYWTFLPALLVFLMFATYAAGLYDFRHKLTWADHFFAGCGAALGGVAPGYLLLALVQLYGFHHVRVSRLAVLIEVGLVVLWLTASRGLMLAWLAQRGYRVRVLLVGPGGACRTLAGEIRTHAPRPVSVEGIISTSDDDAEARNLGGVAELETTVRDRSIDQIILVAIDLPQTALRDLLMRCDRSPAELYLYPELNLSILVNTHLMSIAGLPLISLRPAFTTNLYEQGKRMLDVTAALILLVLTSPILIAGVVAVKLTSSGPAFFKQERLGLHGAPFQVHKLRTMRVDAEAESGPVLSKSNDPRITPIGRFLRKWRVDELPQLWNVLRGEMSLVGPRPERREFSEEFSRENPLYERRLQVRPGLTGLAQIHGRYDTDYTHKLRYDLIYINGISFITDLRILLATIQTVLTGKGAL